MPLVRFFHDGPTTEADVIYPKGALVPVSEKRAAGLVRSGCAVLVVPSERALQAIAPPKKPVEQEVVEVKPLPEARVGIVIPAYNPGRLLGPCLRTLAASDAAPISEVVLVDDGSSPSCAGEAVRLMRGLKLHGRVLRLSSNAGFQYAVNRGAEVVAGNHLLMLSVDTEVSAGFLSPMLETLDQHPKIGVVGNRHLQTSGAVDSAGSVWSWKGGVYRHRGRDEPADVLKPAELDMVTFACCLIRRAAWDELGGLSPHFRQLYWEDTDFCIRARRRGWRILYEPRSEITHHGRHVRQSDGLSSDFFNAEQNNRSLFHELWASKGYPEALARERGGRCDCPMRIVVGMIVLNEEEFLRAALESVYLDADQIVVVVGGVELAREIGLCKNDGGPTDATLDILEAFPDPLDKLKVIGPRLWPMKRQMRDAILAQCREGDMVVMQDADEVFYPRAMWRLFADLQTNDVLRPKREDFWNDLWTLGSGLKWQGVREARVFRFRPGMTYREHHGVPTNLSPRQLTLDYAPWAHYAWVKPLDKLRLKFDYYLNHPLLAGACTPDYVNDVFLRWRGDPEAVEHRTGTHITGGGGTMRYQRRHPPQIEKMILSGAIPGGGW